MRLGADVIATRGRTSTALLYAVQGRVLLYGMHGRHVVVSLARDIMSATLPRTDADLSLPRDVVESTLPRTDTEIALPRDILEVDHP